MTAWMDRHPILFLATLALAMCVVAWTFFRTDVDIAPPTVTPATAAPPVIYTEVSE